MKKTSTYANIPNDIRVRVYRRDGYRCALCDSTQYIQIHHYIPRGKGGSNTMHNLITLCAACHAQAHGTKIYEMDISVDDMEQYIVEYLSDIYADEWNPYKRE